MILVDAHVHIYDCFDLEKFFDSAYSNFKFAAEKLDHADTFTGILLLAETSKENWFQYLSEYADGKDLPDGKTAGKWKFNHTDEFESLCAGSDDKRELFVIAGRQIVTAEHLELLALSTIDSFEDGTSIKQLIELVREKNGLPVIPWGFGKWMGRRGTILKKLLDTAKSSNFYLGDNGNRPFFIPYPSQLKLAQKRNIRNLPGSDSLPSTSESHRAGSFGFTLDGTIYDEKPAEGLNKILNNSVDNIKPFGEPERLLRFFRNQLIIQIKKQALRKKNTTE